MTPEEIEAGVALIELAVKLGERLYAVIESHGALSNEQRAALIARVKAARAAATYVPREV